MRGASPDSVTASLPLLGVTAGLLLLGLAAFADPTSPALLDAWLGERVQLELDGLPARVTLAPDEDFRVSELGRDERTSHHVVAIRRGELPHRHDRHELLVVMLRGHGRMRLGDETRAVGEGSILYVPRATVHAFTNESDEPAVAYTVYSPPFDGQDRIPVD